MLVTDLLLTIWRLGQVDPHEFTISLVYIWASCRILTWSLRPPPQYKQKGFCFSQDSVGVKLSHLQVSMPCKRTPVFLHFLVFGYCRYAHLWVLSVLLVPLVRLRTVLLVSLCVQKDWRVKIKSYSLITIILTPLYMHRENTYVKEEILFKWWIECKLQPSLSVSPREQASLLFTLSLWISLEFAEWSASSAINLILYKEIIIFT